MIMKTYSVLKSRIERLGRVVVPDLKDVLTSGPNLVKQSCLAHALCFSNLPLQPLHHSLS